MNTSEKLIWRIYSGVLGAATTLLAQKLVTKGWSVITGEAPPDPNDPNVPFSEALSWALATGIGVGVAQLSMNRYMSRRWATSMGRMAPGNLRNKLSD